MIGDLTPAQEAEVRRGVVVGEPSNLTQIVPPDRTEGRHVRWSSRTTPTADWWVLMIADQGTCSCEHGPKPWSVAFRGSTCGTCGKAPGRHRRPHALDMGRGTVYRAPEATIWLRVADPHVYPDEKIVPRHNLGCSCWHHQGGDYDRDCWACMALAGDDIGMQRGHRSRRR